MVSARWQVGKTASVCCIMPVISELLDKSGMMPKISCVLREGSGVYDVFNSNGKHMGEFYREVDGYYVWDPAFINRGYIPSDLLRALANKLDEVNALWDRQVRDVS